jgi:serine phosphatase RsbU (regulator of sigma subunit)/putative methionine-R-sulfoxide reductase with GAF domain
MVIENGVKLTDISIPMEDDKRLAIHCYVNAKEIFIGNFPLEVHTYIENIDEIIPVAGESPLSTVYLPLVIKDRILGVITVQSFTENAYDEYHISLLKSLASFVAIAMDNASLYETMEEKVEERTREVTQQKEKLEINYFNTSLLSQIGQLVSSTLKIDEIFDELYEKVNQLMKAEIFAIRIYDEQTNTINFKYTIENGDRCDPFTLKADNPDNYNVWCIRNRKELLINDNLKEYKKYVNEIQVLQGEKPNSLIFYPMIVENKMIGVITIQSFEINAYQPYHLDILKTLAAYIGTVIDNAQLYETLEVKVKERTEELEQKNLDITASINYAKRLQKGILPSRSFMQQLLPESFVLFRPKDIVSGDFYWVDRTSSRILFAVVDCTGHGVPGAMMSIIGRNLLDQAVNEKGITIPSQILNFLQVGLSVAFGQTNNTKTELFDGMDLAICSLNLSTMKLNFAGANSSLYLIQDNELITLKGDKYGVTAEFEQFESYNNIEIDVNKGDRIYLSSDGFPDQFGGPKQKKFTYRRFQQLISNVQQYNMKEQHEIFNTTLDNWQGDLEQTDDICILGVMI